VWIAIKAEIVKENINFKVPVQNLTLVLADVFRA
jgi:hypothetical protein